uniref:Transposase Helix-turn-helix domain-containing protein n=1 Tax=Anopheles quadriannulatus TaxID=34691 RepID=A0A182XPY9_ANOQN
MIKEEFYYLLSRIGPKMIREDTTMRVSISAKQRLCIGLRFLASGGSYKSLSFLFRVSCSSASQIVREVCTLLIDELKEYVK